MVSKKRHVAIYGNTYLERGYCWSCKTMCIIIENEKQCCGGRANGVDIVSLPVKRISDPRYRRRLIGQNEKKKILHEQNYECIYCGIPFGSPYAKKKGNKIFKTRVQIDHFIPFAYSANNKKGNYVASCHLCNAIKSDKIFNNIDEVRLYVIEKIERKGIVFI